MANGYCRKIAREVWNGNLQQQTVSNCIFLSYTPHPFSAPCVLHPRFRSNLALVLLCIVVATAFTVNGELRFSLTGWGMLPLKHFRTS